MFSSIRPFAKVAQAAKAAGLAAVVVLAALSATAGEATFKTKPTATKESGKVVIRFSVSGPTDVAVFVEDAQGKIVRHLVAGVLQGEAPPPAPLKPGLDQAIEWDGKADYGLPAEGGPFKVRVALGLKVAYDRVLSSRPLSFSGTCAMAVGPDGTLYLRHQYSPSVWRHTQILAINRDGSYRRTLLPYASTPDNAEAKGIDAMTIDGRRVPAGRAYERDLFHEIAGPNYSNLSLSPDGKTLYGLAGTAGLLRASTAGGCAEAPLVSKLVAEKNGFGKEPVLFGTGFLAISSDGTRAFVNGLANRYAPAPLSAVYAVPLPARTEHAVFFGDPKQAGNDQTHVGAAPGMLAVDGKGHLFVADTANGRVLVLAEADGKFLGELKTEAPRGLGVDPRHGALYVSSEKGNKVVLRKYATWKDAQPAAEIALERKGWTPNHSLALDASSGPVIVWIAAGGDGQLLRIEDKGASFERTEVSADWRKGQPQECYLSVVVDRKTKEVYTRNGGSGGIWERFNDETGASEVVKLPGNAWSDGGGKGTQITPAPNGRLYGIKWEHSFFQWDRNGKPVAWEERREPTEQELKSYDYDKAASKDPSVSYVPVGMTELPHTLGVRWSDGHLFVLEPTKYGMGGRTFKALHEYLPSGKRVTAPDVPILWKISDGAVGPKFDAAGNIYVA
ncbi:MAG: hypothetical protein KIS92_08455, partial [Planctomycetota bacterium]|nr:hypothetical protein [Planctomycetota bacterium]